MSKYICLLRSINVSGVNRIKMEALRSFFESLGFQNTVTYIQSGNIIFNTHEKPSTTYIENQIQTCFHTKNVAVILKTPEEMATIIAENPFKDQPEFDSKKCYVHYLENIPDQQSIAVLSEYTFEGELFQLKKNIVYAYYLNSRNKAKLSNTFLEKKLRMRSTARNWNTTNKIYTLAITT